MHHALRDACTDIDVGSIDRVRVFAEQPHNRTRHFISSTHCKALAGVQGLDLVQGLCIRLKLGQ